MGKDLNKAGHLLDSFYSGVVSKAKAESSVVYADAAMTSEAAANTLSVCNAEPSRITLAGKVPPIESESDNDKPKGTGVPAQTGVLAIGAVALAVASRKKVGMKSYGEDLNTVVDFLVDLVAPSGGSSQQPNGTPQTTSTNTVVNVNNSSGTVTTSTSTDSSCSQSDPSCYGSAYIPQQIPPYPRP